MERPELIAPEIHHMVRNGSLGASKVLSLIRLREIVDRFSVTPRISEEESAMLREKYGGNPGMITWADYFQTEVAARYFELSDRDFERIVDTIRFDLISAVKIFRNKPESFMKECEIKGLYAWSVDRSEWDSETEEDAHLYVLLGYFREMNLNQVVLSAEDEEWFNEFTSEGLASAG